MSSYKSPFIRPTPENPSPFLEPKLLRDLAVGMPRVPTFLHSGGVTQNEATYLKSILDIFRLGRSKFSRPNGGLWTLSHDEGQYVYDISGNILPLLSTKQIFNRSWLHETIWFLSGSTDIEYLKIHGVSIWDSWVIAGTDRWEPAVEYRYSEMVNWVRLKAGQKILDDWFEHNRLHPSDVSPEQEMLTWWEAKKGFGFGPGPIPKVKLVGGSIGNGAYGSQWRKWEDTRWIDARDKDHDTHAKFVERGFFPEEAWEAGALFTRTIDQMATVIKQLKSDPDGRRIIVTAWNPALIDEAALPPCHSFFQFISYPSDRFQGKRELTIKLTQRSCDALVGGPFNINQYAFLAHLVAHLTGHVATKFVHIPNDYHIYEDQLAFMPEQFKREPIAITPRIEISDRVTSIDDLRFDDFTITGYGPGSYHPAIKYPVAV